MKERILSLDLIRLFAFGLVVIHHSFLLLPGGERQEWFALKGCGRLGVSLFIALSGASLATGALGASPLRFILKRFASILPAYWFAYCATAIALFVFTGRIAMKGDVLAIVQTVCGVDGYLMTVTKNYYLVGEWFVGFILIVYLLAPWIYAAMRKMPILTLAFCGLISLASFYYHPQIVKVVPWWSKAVHFNVTSRLFEFAVGMGWMMYAWRNRRTNRILMMAGVLLFIVLWIACDGNIFSISVPGVCIWVTMFIVIAGVMEMIPHTPMISNVVCRLSALSFLAFLYHHQILYVLRRNAHWRSDFTTLLYLSIADVVLSLVAASLSLRWVNKIRELVFDPLLKKVSK